MKPLTAKKCNFCNARLTGKPAMDRHVAKVHFLKAAIAAQRKRIETSERRTVAGMVKVKCPYCHVLYSKSYIGKHQRWMHTEGLPAKVDLQGGLCNPR